MQKKHRKKTPPTKPKQSNKSGQNCCEITAATKGWAQTKCQPIQGGRVVLGAARASTWAWQLQNKQPKTKIPEK